MKSCSPCKGLFLEKFVENCVPRERPYTGAGEECEEEGVAERTRAELTASLVPCPPVLLGGGGKEFGREVKPRKERGVGGRCFKIGFIYHYPTLI